MQQIPLDIGIERVAKFDNFLDPTGQNAQGLHQLQTLLEQLQTVGASNAHLYLWGEMATGKTHLARALISSVKERGLSVGHLGLPFDEGDGIDCLQNEHQYLEFNQKWSGIVLHDVHLFDDRQQHRAFNWFVNLKAPQDGKPRFVVAFGNAPSKYLSQLREDLRSRLSWGLEFELQPLSEQARKDVLKHSAHELGLVLSDEVIEFILRRFSRDLGSLMQLLKQIDAYAFVNKRGVTVAMVRDMLQQNEQEDRSPVKERNANFET